MSVELGPPFTGWLEEHPDGAFLVLLSDQTDSGPLTTYEAVSDFLASVEPSVDVEQVVRIRHSMTGPDDLKRAISKAWLPWRD